MSRVRDKIKQGIKKLPFYKDEALIVAHLLGGQNGVDFTNWDEERMKLHVGYAILMAREVRKQLAETEE